MLNIFDEVAMAFQEQETIQDKRAFCFDIAELLKGLEQELDELIDKEKLKDDYLHNQYDVKKDK